MFCAAKSSECEKFSIDQTITFNTNVTQMLLTLPGHAETNTL